MKIELHKKASLNIAVIISDELLIENIENGKSLIVDLYYQQFDGLIIYTKNITAQFFDLKTGIAGEILQLAVNFRMHFGIIGDFHKYESKALSDFIWESNKKGQFVFKNNLVEVLDGFS